MKLRIALTVVCIAFISSQVVIAGLIDDLLEKVRTPSTNSIDEKTAVSGLKEALSVGTASAVKSVSRENGYLGNESIRIPLPERVQIIGEVLRNAGFGKEVDTLILGMNRAAENAAPKAKPVFVNAIKDMTFQDAGKILNGGDTAATDYFRAKTSSRLFEAFKPEISSSMKEVGVARQYKAVTERYLSLIPFGSPDSLDLDQYVTNKALAGLFVMLGQEEKKIRMNPAARTTEILRKVFGK